jgi:hypothetical protein
MRLVAAGPVAAVLVGLAVVTSSVVAATGAIAPGGVTVTIDPPAVDTRLGQEFAFTSTVRNDGDRPLPGLIAHLNILSTDPDVYVDPEDWSEERTQFLAPLAPGGAVDLTWRVQAVNSGDLVVYVAVTPSDRSDSVVASNSLRLTVTEQRTIDSSGVLPVALGVPVVVLGLMGAAARRRRRLT